MADINVLDLTEVTPGSNDDLILFNRDTGEAKSTRYGALKNAVTGDVESQIQTLTNVETLSLSDVFTFSSGITITSSTIKKKGHRIYAVLKASGDITTGANGSVQFATIKSDYRPLIPQMCITQFNNTTSGQVYDNASVAVWNDTGSVFLVTGEANHTYGSASYPWTSTSGIIIAWDI